MKNHILIKILLTAQTCLILIYTYFAIRNEGINLAAVFVSNVSALSWSGQFNLDFLCYLVLSGLWIMWRNKFTPKSLVLGVLAMVLGIVLFAPYVIWLIQKEGDLKRVLTGDR
jgi:hypothetical protein